MSSVPEPTEAMVEAGATTAYESAAGTNDPAWAGLDSGSKEIILQDFQAGLLAAIAAASPEWLLGAALSEDEITGLDSIIRSSPYDGSQFGLDLKAKLSRALRGGEET